MTPQSRTRKSNNGNPEFCACVLRLFFLKFEWKHERIHDLDTQRSRQKSVMIVDCDVAIARGDFRAAVGRLKAVPQDSPHFVNARTTLADVYLTQRNDKKRYIQCYEELAE